MTFNPDWHKPKIKPYLQQISLDCLEKLFKCLQKLTIYLIFCKIL